MSRRAAATLRTALSGPDTEPQPYIVRVHRERTFAIARAEPRTPAAPEPRLTPQRLLDRLTVALYQQAAAGHTPPPTKLSPGKLLDLLVKSEQQDDFPYPQSPRLDSAGGGGARVAQDGSPGLSPAWLRYLLRDDPEEQERAAKAGRASAGWYPLIVALSHLAQHEPEAWALYRDHVLSGVSLRQLAARHTLHLSAINRRVARARLVLLTELAVLTDTLDAEQAQALIINESETKAPPLPDRE